MHLHATPPPFLTPCRAVRVSMPSPAALLAEEARCSKTSRTSSFFDNPLADHTPPLRSSSGVTKEVVTWQALPGQQQQEPHAQQAQQDREQVPGSPLVFNTMMRHHHGHSTAGHSTAGECVRQSGMVRVLKVSVGSHCSGAVAWRTGTVLWVCFKANELRSTTLMTLQTA